MTATANDIKERHYALAKQYQSYFKREFTRMHTVILSMTISHRLLLLQRQKDKRSFG
jgi:hypothetical protein